MAVFGFNDSLSLETEEEWEKMGKEKLPPVRFEVCFKFHSSGRQV